MKPSKPWRPDLLKALKDPIEASAYLNAALRGGDINFLLVALRDVAEAQGGITKISRKTKLNRANLYQMMSSHGNPRIHSLEQVLNVFGLKIGVFPDPKVSHRRRAA